MLRRSARFWLLTMLLAASSGALQAQQPPPTEAGIVAQGAKRLGAADFEALYVGNTLSGTTADGEPFHVFVASKSSYRMLYQKQRTEDRWSVGKEGEFCAVAGADTTCTREYALGQVIHSFNPDGSLAGTARIRPGNPEQL
jgi:hypothetical protein